MPITFRAPELLPKKKTYSEAADIWSLGCIIFNMSTGIPPFYDTNIDALENLIVHGEYAGFYPEFDVNASPEL